MPDFLVFFMFVVFYCAITVFHEPWFDEAQAWQIGKCASLHDLLFEIPHYEGHPPFWSILLAIPAKVGVPFEWGLKGIGFLISTASVYVILFKTHYPRVMRLILPFTYFIFYQYGIIVRPYGLMMLFFLLLSISFPTRHEKPLLFIVLLMGLCLTGAYAIVMSGGIAICYLWEILKEKGIKKTLRGILTDRRTLALSALLLLAILLVLEIMPRSDTYVPLKTNANNPFLLCLTAAFFTFLGESTLTTGSWFSQDRLLLQQVYINTKELIAFSILGVILWIVLVSISSKKLIKYLLIPYILFAFFASAVYFSVHHIGVVYILLMFWLGILFQDPDRYEIGQKWIIVLSKTERDKLLFKYAVLLIGTACLLVPVYWNIFACFQDIQKDYSCGTTVAKWIRDNNLENCRFLNVWGRGSLDKDATEEEILLHTNTYMVGMPVEISAYFNHNICMNLNFGHDDEAYIHHKMATVDDNKAALIRWRESGIPDILLQKPMLKDIYGDKISYEDFSLVLILPEHRIWKNLSQPAYTPVYARKDIMEKYGLKPIQDKGFEYYINGFQITDEMKQQYENGVPVEEILKPYLDAIFGEEK